MKKIFSFLSASLLLVAFTIMSCKKENSQENPANVVKTHLVGKTWEVKKVVFIENGISNNIYVKDGADNETDYSLLRLTFKNDGSMIFIDEEGEVENDAKYVLLNNGETIKFSTAEPGSELTAEELTVTANQFSYKVTVVPGHDLVFTFIPAL